MALLRQCVLLAVLPLAAQERPQVFRITPVRPVAELRVEALATRPPQEQGDFLRSDLVDVAKLDPVSSSTSATPPATTFSALPSTRRPAPSCNVPPPKRSSVPIGSW